VAKRREKKESLGLERLSLIAREEKGRRREKK